MKKYILKKQKKQQQHQQKFKRVVLYYIVVVYKNVYVRMLRGHLLALLIQYVILFFFCCLLRKLKVFYVKTHSGRDRKSCMCAVCTVERCVYALNIVFYVEQQYINIYSEFKIDLSKVNYPNWIPATFSISTL